MEIKITMELALALIDYLQTKPYAEVHRLIEALLKSEKVESLPDV
jgi:hypothetical protein